MNAVGSLSALAQTTRLQIFRLLVEAGPEGMAAGGIAEALGLPPPTLSFHLSQLRHAGLVSAERRGRSIVYAANFARMRELLTFLTRNCCRGRPEICLPLLDSLATCSQSQEASS